MAAEVTIHQQEAPNGRASGNYPVQEVRLPKFPDIQRWNSAGELLLFARRGSVEGASFLGRTGGRRADIEELPPGLDLGVDRSRLDLRRSFRLEFPASRMEIVGVSRTREMGEPNQEQRILLISSGPQIEGIERPRYDITNTIPVRYDDTFAFVYPRVDDGSAYSSITYVEVGEDSFGQHTMGYRRSSEASLRLSETDGQRRILIDAAIEHERRAKAVRPDPLILFRPAIGAQSRRNE